MADDSIKPEPTEEGAEPEEATGSEVTPEDVAGAGSAAELVEGEEEGPEDDAAEESARALVTYDPLQRYLTEIRRYALLSREEEHELAVRYAQQQDVDAAYRLVTANLRLVVMIAREYQKASRNLLDLIQEGNIGLMEAVKKFDPYRGIRFPSYAVWWIRAYIIRYLMNNWRMVKLGTTQAQRKLFFNLQKEKEKLEAEGIWPGPKLIAQRLDVKESEVIEMEQRLAARDLSVDAAADDGEGRTLLDALPAREAPTEDQVADAEFRAQVGQKIREFGATLEGKEAVIFESRLLADKPATLQEIGEQFKISRERVRQIEERLKKKMRAYLLEQLKDLEDVATFLD